jgi:hypothetical protein
MSVRVPCVWMPCDFYTLHAPRNPHPLSTPRLCRKPSCRSTRPATVVVLSVSPDAVNVVNTQPRAQVFLFEMCKVKPSPPRLPSARRPSLIRTHSSNLLRNTLRTAWRRTCAWSDTRFSRFGQHQQIMLMSGFCEAQALNTLLPASLTPQRRQHSTPTRACCFPSSYMRFEAIARLPQDSSA